MGRSPKTDAAAALALALGLAVVASAAGPQVASAADAPVELRFARHGEPVAALALDALREAVPPGEVRVFEPYEQREVVFRALPFAALLDTIYGDAWRSEEELLFTCSDGYQPSLPVARVLAHRAWLAFGRADRPSFHVRKHESGRDQQVDVGPFYLVWENLDDPLVRQEWDYGWPYQLVGVDLIRTRERFPAIFPPDDASPEVRAGFEAFRVHCIKCHQLNGEGGEIGPPLSAAANPLAHRERDWLRTWIEDPKRISPETRMPALNPDLPDRARTVDHILAYLEVMLAAPASAEP